jgi:signal transduction histidine kinase
VDLFWAAFSENPVEERGMTLGTSPRWGIPFRRGAEAIERGGAEHWPLRAAILNMRWHWLAKGAAALHLFGLAMIMTMGWHDPVAAASGAIGGLPALHLAFLLTTGAAAAMLTLGNRPAEEPPSLALDHMQPPAGVDQLLAQMSHELRTPLNAMIGFSELMLRELYGPLGHARYQEYAAHISESGDRLLKSAEDALAVTETMSAVMADRLAGRCERALASGLVREAWAAVGVAGTTVRLSVSNCSACDMPCERRATSQALQHLLREAVARAPASGTVEVRGRRRGGARSIEIRVATASEQAAGGAPDAVPHGQGRACTPAGSNLRVMLARLLLEMQGATLSLWEDDEGSWWACVAFPPR